MCESCYIFQRDHPEEATQNQAAYLERQSKKREAELDAVKAHRFRVYLFEEHEKMASSPYAALITKIAFTKYPVETPKGRANHTIPLLTEKEAQNIVEVLGRKGLTVWYDDSEYQKRMGM